MAIQTNFANTLKNEMRKNGKNTSLNARNSSFYGYMSLVGRVLKLTVLWNASKFLFDLCKMLHRLF